LSRSQTSPGVEIRRSFVFERSPGVETNARALEVVDARRMPKRMAFSSSNAKLGDNAQGCMKQTRCSTPTRSPTMPILMPDEIGLESSFNAHRGQALKYPAEKL